MKAVFLSMSDLKVFVNLGGTRPLNFYPLIHKKKKAEDTPEPTAPKIILELIRYDRDRHMRHDNLTADELFKEIDPQQVNWVNLDCLHDSTIIEKIQSHFCLHALVIDDILGDQRPKSEEYEDYLFFTMKMLYRIDGFEIDYEQVSFVLGSHFLISFQEKEGDIFEGFRERIKQDLGKVRKKKADYLLYRLLDIIIDSYYTVLDRIGDIIDEIEEEIHSNPSNKNFNKIQQLRKELIYLRRAVFPLREALNKIIKGESVFVEEENLRYYSDIYDHVVHLTDSLDIYKDLTSSLLDVHMNTLNTRMNEVMKVLAVISTIFMPLTFIVGIYGMNFDHMPELKWHYGYFGVLGFMAILAVFMLAFFKRKKWF
jgi:magnesium transporter